MAEKYRASPTPSFDLSGSIPGNQGRDSQNFGKPSIASRSSDQLARLDFEPPRPSPPASNTNSLSRAGTLSWQQRPSSRGSGTGKGRPISLLSSENNTPKSPRATPDTPTEKEQDVSRADVARSLERKDPSWFRQTADRGTGSAAYRKNEEADSKSASGSVRLPGMPKGSNKQSEDKSTQESEDVDKRSSGESESKSTFSTPHSLTTATASSRSKSPLPMLPSQQLEPSQRNSVNFATRDGSPSRGLAMSPTQRSLSPERLERPASPTKGAGGFVQSAMLRRSDSINKHMRANSQVTPSLSRSNSVLSTHNEGTGGPNEGTSSTTRGRNLEDNEGFIKPALPNRSRSQLQDLETSTKSAEVTPPLTPSRTLEPNRWSPTKTTWLESAIQKTDSPKPKQSPQKSPMWLSELQKSKQSSASGEEVKLLSHKPVEVGGFIRTPPLGSASKSPSRGGFPNVSVNKRVPSPSRPDRAFVDPRADRKDEETKTSLKTSITPLSSPSLSQTKPPQASPDPEKMEGSAHGIKVETSTRKTSATGKPKPETPPKKDFRSNLKSRDPTKEKGATEEAEFKNVFGRLKKTETKNYVAPDELKNNITRGKAGLALTGGPRKYEKRDDFKDSILKKKDEMKIGGSVRGRPTPAPKPAESSLPEAIARQRGLAPKPLSRTPSAEQPKPEPPQKQMSVQVESPKLAPIEKKTSAPARLQVGAGSSSSSLADRFNPSLAGIIARGPAPMSPAAPPEQSESPGPMEENKQLHSPPESSELAHATKSRARGPKRRLPASAKTKDTTSSSSEPKSIPEPRKSAIEDAVPPPKPSIASAKPNAETLTSQADQKDQKPVSQPKLLTVSSPRPAASVSKGSRANDCVDGFSSSPTMASSSKADSSISSPKARAGNVSPTLVPKSPPVVKPKPVVSEAKPSEENLGSIRPNARSGGGLSPEISKSKAFPPKSPKSPPIPSDKSKAMARLTSNGISSPQIKGLGLSSGSLASPKIQSSLKVFGGFFDTTSSSANKAKIDTPALLTGNSRSEGKIKTLRKDIWEISGDGRKSPLASHQEHILFEDKMYLCKHVFGSSNGKRTTEVYLWCGDQVSQSAIEDSQLFARNEARDTGGKLQMLSQGKESSNFFEALGGIVITRRTSAATYTLCGRRHMGQIAFDEVEHSQQSLCSGFPFIVAASDGNLYLWKGKGSHADELGCARLIAMDLGLTGEITEIDEGSEPPAFSEALKSGVKTTPRAEHWSKKGSAEKYETRLFAVDIEARPKSASSFTGLFTRRQSAPSTEDPSGQIREISPYSQADIARDGIYMLDAFFEIYM